MKHNLDSTVPFTVRVKEHSAVLFVGADVLALNVILCFPGPTSDSKPFAHEGSDVTCLSYEKSTLLFLASRL